MKKIAICLITTCLLLTLQPLHLNAKTTIVMRSLTYSRYIESERAKALLSRLYEINSIAKSNLTSREKKNLRTEVLSIRNELRPINGGIYLSGGAIILIIILLIILL